MSDIEEKIHIEEEKEIKKVINPYRHFNNIVRSVPGYTEFSYVQNGRLYMYSDSQYAPMLILESNDRFDKIHGVFKLGHDELEAFLKDYRNDVVEINIEDGLFNLTTNIPGLEYRTIMSDSDYRDFEIVKMYCDNVILELDRCSNVHKYEFESKESYHEWVAEDPGYIYFNRDTGLATLEEDGSDVCFRIKKKFLTKSVKSSVDPYYIEYEIDQDYSYVEYVITNNHFTAHQYFKIITY